MQRGPRASSPTSTCHRVRGGLGILGRGAASEDSRELTFVEPLGLPVSRTGEPVLGGGSGEGLLEKAILPGGTQSP